MKIKLPKLPAALQRLLPTIEREHAHRIQVQDENGNWVNVMASQNAPDLHAQSLLAQVSRGAPAPPRLLRIDVTSVVFSVRKETIVPATAPEPADAE